MSFRHGFSQSTWSIAIIETKILQRRFVGSESVSDDRLRLDRLVAKETPEKLQCRCRVPAWLNDQVEDFAFVVDRSPKVHALTADLADHLVEVPATRGWMPAFLQVRRDLGTELGHPAADCFIAHVDAPLGQQLLDVAQTQREAEIKIASRAPVPVLDRRVGPDGPKAVAWRVWLAR